MPWSVSTENYLRFRPLKWVLPGVYRDITRRNALVNYAQVLQYYAAEFLFDWRHNVSTAGIVPRDRLIFEDAAVQQHSSRYRPTPPMVIQAGLECLLEQAPDARDYPLVDFGSGPGRVLICAAYMGFRRLVGIELSPQLVELGRRNLGRLGHLSSEPEAEIVDLDATAYELPSDCRAAYLFDPFKGPVLAAVLENIRASVERSPRPFYLVTYFLDQANLERHGFRKIDQRWGASLYRLAVDVV